jgi:16S rRNA processing protein RimM
MSQKFTHGTSVFDLRIGKATGVHGLKGTLRVRCEFNNPALIMDATKVLFTKEDTVVSESEIERMRFEKGLLYVGLKNHTVREDVEKYIGLDVMFSRAELPDLDENEWWVNDLVGIDVYTTKGELIGSVSDVLGDRGEFLEITKCGDTKQEPILVPFVKQLVPVVDVPGRRIEVEPLPGLLGEP